MPTQREIVWAPNLLYMMTLIQSPGFNVFFISIHFVFPKMAVKGEHSPLSPPKSATDNYYIAGIYYESFNDANRRALAKIKASIYLWIHIIHTKSISSN